MTDLVFISGDFSSGTTLLFTLFRNTPGCRCLYEPLHQQLLPWRFWSPRAYDGHANVGTYFDEFKTLGAVPRLFDASWGVSRLHIAEDEEAPELRRYLEYVIGASYAHAPTVVLKENRLAFRLGWLRRNFPLARIVNVWRDVDDQWQSWVRRSQEYRGREDVGQNSVDFGAFRLAAMCDDLAPTHPELAREASSSGFERFAKLWELSRREHELHADVCVNLRELHDDFEGALERISAAAGVELDPLRLRPLVATDRRDARAAMIRPRRRSLIDRAGMRYAELRARLQERHAPGSRAHGTWPQH